MLDFLPQFQSLLLLAGLSACPAPVKVPAEVLFRMEKPVYVSKYSSSQLGRMKNAKVVEYKGKLISGIVGYTQGDMLYRYAAEVDVAPYAGGMQCVALKKVTLAITYSPKVYVASDHDFFGCTFAHVARHEAKHIKADVAVMTQHLPSLKNTLEEAAQKVPVTPVIPKSVEQRRNDIRLDLQRAAQPLVAKIRAERLKAHAPYDTQEAYDREIQACAHPP